MSWLSPPNSPIRDWASRSVWVVGGSTGIGLALGQALEQRGARLCVSSRRPEALVQGFPSDEVLKIACDIARPQAVEQALAQQSERARLPDVIFWVAGDYQPMSVVSFEPQRARALIDLNLCAALDGLHAICQAWGLSDSAPRAIRPAAPRHLCWFGSVAGYRGLPQALAYSASKAGLMAVAETSHVELKPHGVDVSIVSPGFVKTRLTEQNDFKMPGLISPEQAARETLAGLAKGSFEIHYPKGFTRGMKLLRILPHRIALSLLSGVRPR